MIMKTMKNPWPVAIIAIFVVFICSTIFLVVFACSHKMDLVSSDYYEQEIGFQRHLDQMGQAYRAQQPASIAYDPAAGRIRISCLAEPSVPVSGNVQLYRPSAAAMDRHFKLTLDSQGVQSLDASTLRSGLWKVRVSWSVDNQDFFLEKNIIIRATPHTGGIG
jgi:hypothetical protein